MAGKKKPPAGPRLPSADEPFWTATAAWYQQQPKDHQLALIEEACAFVEQLGRAETDEERFSTILLWLASRDRMALASEALRVLSEVGAPGTALDAVLAAMDLTQKRPEKAPRKPTK